MKTLTESEIKKYTHYLTGTLARDLKESQQHETAKDIETCADMIETLLREVARWKEIAQR